MTAGRTDDGPLISVVTVTYNGAATLERTIESVLGQTHQPVDYVIVDGGSTDGTLDIIRRYEDRLRYVSEPDNGIYDAMNKGIRMARGSWIHILNGDDYYASPESLERAVSGLDQGRTNYFDMYREYEDGSRVLQSFRFRHWRLFVSAYLPHPSLIVSRAQYEAVGFYNPEYRIAADHDMILRLLSRYPAKHEPFPLTVMTQGGVSGRHLRLSLEEFRQVTCAHGLPSAAASAIRLAKNVWWGARSLAR